MPSPASLSGAPRWPAVLVLAGVAVALCAWATGVAGVSLTPSLQIGATWAAATAVQLGTVGLLRWRARLDPERAVWATFRQAATAGLVAMGATAVLGVVVGGVWSTHPFLLHPTLAFPFFFAALARWNTRWTRRKVIGDTLIALAGMVTFVAVLEILFGVHPGDLSDRFLWERISGFAQVSALVVLCLGTASVSFLAGILRDRRTWLVMATSALPLLGVAAETVGGESTGLSTLASGVAAVCLCRAATRVPLRAPQRPHNPAESSALAFAMICEATLVLVWASVAAPGPLPLWLLAASLLAAAVTLLSSVTELSQLHATRQEALTDELTGLANRRAVLRELAVRCDDDRAFVLALVDLDKFKEVNDGLGHAAGDDLLQQVSRRLTEALGPTDLVGRLGGDEFAVLRDATGDAVADAEQLGRDLDRALVETFGIAGVQVHVAASIGLARAASVGAGRDGLGPQLLLRRADIAMYDAKARGGFVVHDENRHVDSSGHLALVAEIRSGLRAGEFVLHHQPQLTVTTGEPTGVESLVRWQHPQRGLLFPADFLHLAEAHGLMGALTDVVLVEAIDQAAEWARQGRRLRVSVNLSVSSLLDQGLPGRVRELLDARGVPAEMLVLEVTESVLFTETERSRAVLQGLTDLGVTLSIDDFGTGYASLTYLREMPVGELKLDRSFTASLLVDPRTAAIVSSTVELAHRLGLRVVAEGVEDGETLAHLAALGCDETQGYLHSRPLPAAALEQWLDGARQRVSHPHTVGTAVARGAAGA